MNNKQRLFIPLLNNDGEKSEVALHFGHAPFFGFYDFETKKLDIIENNLNHDNSAKSPVDQIIESMNPTIVFAQDMGMKAINLFNEKNVALKTGRYKTVKEIINNFDSLKELNNSCDH